MTSTLPYPAAVDDRDATPELARFCTSFFTAKTKHQVEQTHAHFHPGRTVYHDATLGWEFPTNAALREVWEQYMPRWAESARSYPVQILGDLSGAAIVMTDTPELFGGEIRGIAIVDFSDEKIVRWVDYWDARGFGAAAAEQMRVKPEDYPDDLGLGTLAPQPATALEASVERAMAAIASADATRLGEVLAYDATLEDFALRTQIRGREAIGRYLTRASGRLPYQDATVSHVVGHERGGGFEWTCAGGPVPRGAGVLSLDEERKIRSLTICWDGSLVDDEKLTVLTSLAVEPRR